MRDVVVFMLFVGLLPLSFVRPWVGVCAFSWLAYNRSQDLTWGFARTLPISQFLGISMILGWLVWELKPWPMRNPRCKAMLALVVWIGISIFSNTVRWEVQGARYIELFKIVLVVLITGALMTTRARLRHLCLIIALGLGFYGSKNGLLFLAGSKSIAGPGGMLKDNNDFALAMVMSIPFHWYLWKEAREVPKWGKWISRFMVFALPTTLLTVVSTGSRGAFLSLSVGVFVAAMKTKYKVPSLAGMALIGILGFTFAPQEYKDRIMTIFDSAEEQDESVQGRFVSWKVAGNMIMAYPIKGIGANNMVAEYNNHTQGIPNEHGGTEHFARVTHNSYLQIWAESGTPAFLLWMFMVVGTIFATWRLGKRFKREGDDWAVNYCNAIQVSMTSFMCGATFLNRAHFDLIYHMAVISAVLPAIVANERRITGKRRAGPRPAEVVEVTHADPFVRVGGS